jgi:hypothetical protein
VNEAVVSAVQSATEAAFGFEVLLLASSINFLGQDVAQKSKEEQNGCNRGFHDFNISGEGEEIQQVSASKGKNKKHR